MNKHPRKYLGFTLTDVLVALAVVTVVSAVVIPRMSLGVLDSKPTPVRPESRQPHQPTPAKIEEQLRNLLNYDLSDSGGLEDVYAKLPPSLPDKLADNGGG